MFASLNSVCMYFTSDGECHSVQRVSNGFSIGVGKVKPRTQSLPVNDMIARASSDHSPRNSSGQSPATYGNTTFASPQITRRHQSELDSHSGQLVRCSRRVPAQQQPTPRVPWYWEDDNGKWWEYARDTSDGLERAYGNDPNGKEILRVEKNTYSVVFSQMEQVNVSTGKARRVKRVPRQVAQVTSVSQSHQVNDMNICPS